MALTPAFLHLSPCSQADPVSGAGRFTAPRSRPIPSPFPHHQPSLPYSRLRQRGLGAEDFKSQEQERSWR